MWIDPMFTQGFIIASDTENPRHVLPVPVTKIRAEIAGAVVEFGVGSQFQKQHEFPGGVTTVVVVGIFLVDQEIYPYASDCIKSYFQQFYVLAYTSGDMEMIQGEQLCYQMIDDKPYSSWHPRNDIDTQIKITKL